MPAQNSFLDKVQAWSQIMDDLYDAEIHQKVVHHTRTTFNGSMNPLGFPHKMIQPDILEQGRCNFSKAYEHPDYERLSTSDKVLLYCFMNLRGHFHSTRAHFKMDAAFLRECLVDLRPVLIDIGCGPGTTALAFAHLFRKKTFSYHAVDSAKAMRGRAELLFDAAKKQKLITSNSTIKTYASWDDLPSSFGRHSTVMFNFAFFFASEQLKASAIKSLAGVVKQVGMGRTDKSVILSYTNGKEKVSQKHYHTFLEELGYSAEYELFKVEYKLRLNRSDTRVQPFVRELAVLEFK